MFDRPQIRALVRDQDFVRKKDKERGAWFSFVAVTENFLGNKKVNNHESHVTNLLSVFHDLGCSLSIKLHFLYSYFDRFPENLGAISAKQGERFHQDLKTMEERYQRKLNKHMMQTTAGKLNEITLIQSSIERASCINSCLTKM